MTTAKKVVLYSIGVAVVVTVLVVKGELDQDEAIAGVERFSNTGFSIIGAMFSGLWNLIF